MKETLDIEKKIRNILFHLVVYGKDKVEHKNSFQKVWQRLRDQGLKLNLNEFVFMGHILSDQEIMADKAKVEQSLMLKVSRDLSVTVQDSFRTVEPLRILTRRNTEWTWSDV